MTNLVMLSAYEHGPGLIIRVSCVNDRRGPSLFFKSSLNENCKTNYAKPLQ